MVKTESRDGNRRREKKNVKYETIWLQTHHPAVVQPSASHWAVLLLCYLCCWPDRWWLTCRITVWVCVCVFNLFLSMCTSSSGCQIISYCRVVIVCVCVDLYIWVIFHELNSVCCVYIFFPPLPESSVSCQVSDAVILPARVFVLECLCVYVWKEIIWVHWCAWQTNICTLHLWYVCSDAWCMCIACVCVSVCVFCSEVTDNSEMSFS